MKIVKSIKFHKTGIQITNLERVVLEKLTNRICSAEGEGKAYVPTGYKI